MITGPPHLGEGEQTVSEHAARYEALRRHVVEHSPAVLRDGLAVLLGQGLAAWMKAWSMLPSAPTRSSETESTRPWPVPEGMSTEVVRVLVAMTLGHVPEVRV